MNESKQVESRQASGPSIEDEHGAEFLDVDGRPVYLTHDTVMSARPNDRALLENGESYVTLVWLKGHRRPVALQSTWAEFRSWRFSRNAA